MIANGLLWYDDDTRRPLALKIAEAVDRYRERVGYEPTTCELSPAQAPEALAATQPPARRTRKRDALPRVTLHVEPNNHLKPNYILVGIVEGETPRAVRGWADPAAAEPERLPSRRTRARMRTTDPSPPVAPPGSRRARVATPAISSPAASAPPAAPRPRSVVAKPARHVLAAAAAGVAKPAAPAARTTASSTPPGQSVHAPDTRQRRGSRMKPAATTAAPVTPAAGASALTPATSARPRRKPREMSLAPAVPTRPTRARAKEKAPAKGRTAAATKPPRTHATAPVQPIRPKLVKAHATEPATVAPVRHRRGAKTRSASPSPAPTPVSAIPSSSMPAVRRSRGTRASSSRGVQSTMQADLWGAAAPAALPASVSHRKRSA